jgi:hypothetical protein
MFGCPLVPKAVDNHTLSLMIMQTLYYFALVDHCISSPRHIGPSRDVSFASHAVFFDESES